MYTSGEIIFLKNAYQDMELIQISSFLFWFVFFFFNFDVVNIGKRVWQAVGQ